MSSSTSSSSSYMRRMVRSRSATTSQRLSRMMICEPTAVITFSRFGRSHWSTSSNSAVRSSPSILPGIVQAQEREQPWARRRASRRTRRCGRRLLPARVPDQVRDLVGQPVRGGRGPAHVAVLAERQAVVAQDEHGRVVRDRVEQLAELVVHGLHVVHVRLAHAVDVLVGEVERDHAAVGAPEAVVLHPAGPHVERRRGVRVDRVERVHPDEERASRPSPRRSAFAALAERALGGLGEPRERLQQLLVEPGGERVAGRRGDGRCRRARARPRSAGPGRAGCRSRRSSRRRPARVRSIRSGW